MFWEIRVEYPWKRTSLMRYLSECSDPEFQKRVWGTNHNGVYEAIDAVFDYIIEDENLDDDATTAVGYYLLADEVPFVEDFAKKLRSVHNAMRNVGEEYELLSRPDWPEMLNLAAVALDQIVKNNIAINFRD